jgi:hypothetical protein
MNDINVDVNDYSLVTTNIINNIKIRVMNLTLFTSVSLSVGLYTDKILVENQNLMLIGDDYTNWMNDDNYIIQYVLNKLGLTQVTVS